MVGYSPGNVSHPDTGSYVDAAAHSLFSNPFRPAGYSLFLRVLHSVSTDLRFTIVVQHLLGLGAAVLAYVICRQIGARRGVALVPAAAVLLSGDELYLEYSVLSDTLFLTAVLLACALGLRIREPHRPAYAITLVAAAVTALSATLRTVGVALVPLFVLWLLRYGSGRLRARVRASLAAAVVCAVVLVGYAAAQDRATGVFGLSRFSAWPLYARLAPIADCSRFKPPPRTARLCDPLPVAERPGPDFYLWNPESPAQRLGFPPADSGLVGAFARSAILHEPLTYLFMVTRDLARYVDPGLETAPQWGADSRSMALNQPWDTPVAFGLHAVGSYYGHPRLEVRPALMNGLERWRRIFRLHGVLIALSALATALGLFLSPSRRTTGGLALLAGFALALFLVPTATLSYEARYGVPGAILLFIGSARGVELATLRVYAAARSRRARRRDGVGPEPRLTGGPAGRSRPSRRAGGRLRTAAVAGLSVPGAWRDRQGPRRRESGD